MCLAFGARVTPWLCSALPERLHPSRSCPTVQNSSDLALWQPLVHEQLLPDGSIQRSEASWLPWYVGLSSQPSDWRVEVQQADSLVELQQMMGTAPEAQQAGGGNGDEAAPVQAVYELTGAVFHIRDEDEEPVPGRKGWVAQRPGS